MQTLLEINSSLSTIGCAIVVIAPALGVAWVLVSVINGTTRQPETRGTMMSTALVSFAVVEAPAITVAALASVPQ